MKYINRETGVILEPASEEAAATLEADARYAPTTEEPREKPAGRRRKSEEPREG